jgi:hypothetical protein
MKPLHACVACALLGQLWLSACSSSSKRNVPAPSDAGAAGETTAPSAGTGNEPGEGGASGAPSPGEGGEGGIDSSAGMGGEGGALACFSDSLGAAGAPDRGIAVDPFDARVVFDCAWLADHLQPTYDSVNHRVTFDASQLGPVAGGTFTLRAPVTVGEVTTTECVEGETTRVDGLVSLAVPAGALSLDISAFSVHDQCENVAALDLSGENGTCFSFGFYPNNEGGWAIECFEGGNCNPSTCTPNGPTD